MFFFFQAEDGIRDVAVTGVQTCALPICTPNKSTAEIREAYQKLVEDNLTNMTEWLGEVAKQNPERAMDLMLKLSEYMIPKLARQEVTGADGADRKSVV